RNHPHLPSFPTRRSSDLVATHPHTLPLRGGDFVPDAFTRDLALELSEGEQDVQRKTSHRAGGIQLLGDGDERNRMAVEAFDDFRSEEHTSELQSRFDLVC